MVGRCAMLNCKNSRRKGIRTFRFPRDKTRRAKWELLCGRGDFKATDNAELCEVHFTDDLFENKRQDGRRPLKWFAVPNRALPNTAIVKEAIKEHSKAVQKSIPEVKNSFQKSAANLDPHCISIMAENTPALMINFEKLINPEPSSFYQEISEEVLPEKYRNVIVSSSGSETLIRSSICNMTELDDWVKTFGTNTRTRWIVRKTQPEISCTRILCGKDYVCQHSNYHKAVTDDQNMHKKGISKNTKCEARIRIRIKRSSSYMKQRDSHIKDGLPGIITIRVKHNHSSPSMSSLKQLTSAKNVRDIFFEYFNKHMSPTQECKLQLSAGGCESELVQNNMQINILKQTIMHWFETWRREKRELMQLDSSNENDTSDELEKIYISNSAPTVTVSHQELSGIENIILTPEDELSNDEEDFIIQEEDVNDGIDNIDCSVISEDEIDEWEPHSQGDPFKDVIGRMKLLHSEFGSPHNILRALEERLDGIVTRDEWETFLYAAAQ